MLVSKEETFDEWNFETILQNSLTLLQKWVDLKAIGKLANCKDIWGYKPTLLLIIRKNKINEVNYTIWKASLVGRKAPQKFGKMIARFDIFNFNFGFVLFFHITFKHCRKNGRTHGEMASVHGKINSFHNQRFIRFNPINWFNYLTLKSMFYLP